MMESPRDVCDSDWCVLSCNIRMPSLCLDRFGLLVSLLDQEFNILIFALRQPSNCDLFLVWRVALLAPIVRGITLRVLSLLDVLLQS